MSNNKFHEILDGLNNEIIKIKEQLTKNKETESLVHSDNFINKSNEIFTEENCINQGIRKKDPQNTFVVEMLKKSSTDHEYCNRSKIKLNIHSNQYGNIGYQNNLECTDEQTINDQQKNIIPKQKTSERFYKIQPSDHKTKDLIRIVHFFSEHNPRVCQCGMINNI